MEIALVVNDRIENVILAESVQWAIDNLGGEWIDLTGIPGAGIGWLRTVGVWAAPVVPPPVPVTRYVLTSLEWIQTWTDAEWRQLKTASIADTPVGRKIDKLLDAIKLSGSFDVQGDTAETFYGFLETNAYITTQRRAELQAGITE